MNKIIIEFLTEKGKDAYKEISGIKQTIRERLITSRTFKEIKIDEGKIEIEVKIPWLGEQFKLDEKIIETMTLKDCDRDLDYTLEVE